MKTNFFVTFRKYSLLLAESFDAWRVVPRIILFMYGTLVYNLYTWFKNIPTYTKIQCDTSLINTLLNNNISLERAKALACSVVDVVGGPTTEQTAFVTTIVGLSAGIFGLYTSTGRRWDSGMPKDLNKSFKDDNNDGIPDDQQ